MTRRQRAIGTLIVLVLLVGTFAGIRSWASLITVTPKAVEENRGPFSATPRQPIAIERIVTMPSVYSESALQRRAARVVLHAAAARQQAAPAEPSGLGNLLRWLSRLDNGHDGEVLTMVDGKPQWLSPHAPGNTTARPATSRTSNGDIVERDSSPRRGGGGGGSSLTQTTVTQYITQTIDSAEWTLSGTGVTLSDNDNYVGIGTSTPRTKLEVAGTISGASIAVSENATINGSLWVLGTVSGSQLGGFGLTDCDASNQKLEWDATSGRFTCGTAITTGTGNILAAGDPRYVNVGGDTMTGALTINLSSGTVGLNVLQTISGATIFASRGLSTSGALVVNGVSRFKNNLSAVGTLSGAALTVMNGNSYVLGNFGIGKTTSPKAKLDIVGTISGSLLTLSNLRNCDTIDTDANGALTCGTDGGNTYFAGQGLSLVGSSFRLNSTITGATLAFGTVSGGLLTINGAGTNYIRSGNLSIGKMTSAAKLDVVGTISGSALTVNGAGLNYLIGNTGIGKSSTPKAKLDVLGTISGSLITQNGAGNNSFMGKVVIGGTSLISSAYTLESTGRSLLKNISVGETRASGEAIESTGHLVLLGGAASSIKFGSASNETLMVLNNSTGNIGINTAAPKSKLDVLGTISGSLITQNGAGANYLRGKLGIGTTTPASALVLQGTAGALEFQVHGESAANNIAIVQPDDDIALLNYNLNTEVLSLGFDIHVNIPGNRVGIGTAAPRATLDVVGTISGSALTVSDLRNCDTIDTNANGNTACGTDSTSDERLKTNIVDLENGALAFLTHLRTVRYDWNQTMLGLHPNAADDGTQIGFIAQDFEGIYDELVRTDGNGYLGLRYSHITPLIVQGLRELNQKVESLTGSTLAAAVDLAPLEVGLASLSDRLALLESEVHSLSGSLAQPSDGNTPSHLTASTLNLDDTISVGTDARIAGDLHLDGSLYVNDFLLPGLLTADSTITNTLSVTSDAVIHGSLTLDGPLVLGSGALLQFGPGLTLADLVVENSLSVIGNLTIDGLATFLGDVAIEGELRVSSRQAGNATIERGATSTTVAFIPPLTRTPVVSATPQDFVTVSWRVTAKSATGFTIQLAAPETSSLQFDWTATVTTDNLVESTFLDEGVPFPLDSRGVPVSSSLQWNACLRGVPLFDTTGQPYSCGRYHNFNEWEHPDLGIIFVWNDSVTPPYLNLPEGYTATVTEDAATIDAATAAVNAAQSAGDPEETAPDVTPLSASSSDASVSSDTSSSVSSASALDMSSSSDMISAPAELVVSPAEEPVMTLGDADTIPADVTMSGH